LHCIATHTQKEKADEQLRQRGLEVTVVDGERLHSLLALNKPSNRSLSALTQIVPASGWASHSFEINCMDIADVLEFMRRERAGDH